MTVAQCSCRDSQDEQLERLPAAAARGATFVEAYSCSVKVPQRWQRNARSHRRL